MKLRNVIIIIVVICAVVYLPSLFKSENTVKQVTTKYVVENTHIVKPHYNAWGVKGMVRNTSPYPIRGYVHIKFINSNGDIVHDNYAPVNDADPLPSGVGCYFEYFVEPVRFHDVVKFDIKFIEK